jgi:acyl carrier protein
MNRENILEKLTEIFKDVFGDESLAITETTNADDIEGWDSLTHITIIEAVQGEYNIAFDLDEVIEMKNVGDMVDNIEKKIRR